MIIFVTQLKILDGQYDKTSGFTLKPSLSTKKSGDWVSITSTVSSSSRHGGPERVVSESRLQPLMSWYSKQ